MKNFRTFDLAVSFYHLSASLNLRGALKDQLQRAALSIPLNLTEGRAKPTLKDQKRFFAVAFASAKECQAILQIAGLQEHAAWLVLDSVTAHIFRLIERAR